MKAKLPTTCDDCGAPITIVMDDPDGRGLDGDITLVCDECPFEQWIPGETEARTRITALRQIAREHQARRVEGYLVDAMTACLLVSVYDALTPENRRKFGKPSLLRLVDFAWKNVKQA
jgi:hypothetical protein